MSFDDSSPLGYFKKRSLSKIAQLFKALKQIQFSGQLIWQSPDGQQWTLFLQLGQLVYGTGGIHPVRRWQRHLLTKCPQLKLDLKQLEEELLAAEDWAFPSCWEYQLLYAWITQQKVAELTISQVIQEIIAEVFFDVAQTLNVTYQLERSQPIATKFVPVSVNQEAILAAVERSWQVWLSLNLENYSPNLAPIIQNSEQIRASTTPTTYKMLVALLDGQHTLRDLAIKTHRETLQLTQALLPYIQLDWIDLVPIADYTAPNIPFKPQRSAANPEALLIACIDDSAMVCQSMEQVIRGAGYGFIAIREASRAIAMLLAKKPHLIFLDLIMPETNGYEICSQLRKVSMFKNTPIIILSGNDGIVDQVRARLLGATDFLSKPMEPAVVLNIIRKYLKHAALI
jgi:chemotaxis family two-component system response regulator PixG